MYSVRDGLLLARVRRLTELGLGLDEVRDVLADDAGRDLEEVLEELDADLARQETAIRERRLPTGCSTRSPGAADRASRRASPTPCSRSTPPAQAAVVRLVMEAFTQRGRA
ncbi:hypothetical protein [Streptomyces sp. NPDC047718]|uniref:hypothetical protein n=1 Tax=Streptomyces sp. NPDC047718 TaxID=3155479 RepID=UPI0033C7EB7F